MNKSCLSCQVHPDNECIVCKEKWCDECTLVTNPMYTWEYNGSPKHMCLGCYRRGSISHVRKQRSAMALRDLFRECRRVVPKGYLTVSAEIEDHRPGADRPSILWNIYHAKAGHFSSYHQKKAYEDFCKKHGAKPRKKKDREDII